MTGASDIERADNLLGALSVAVAERLYESVTTATGRPRTDTAALVILGSVLDGTSQENLASALSLTQSGVVRLVDRLAAAGLVSREPGPDARTHAIRLSPTGREAANDAAAGRQAATRALTATLDPAQRAGLTAALEIMLDQLTTSRAEAFRICRLCDPVACGHFTGKCPVTDAAIKLSQQSVPETAE